MKNIIKINLLAVFLFIFLSLVIEDARDFSPTWLLLPISVPFLTGIVISLRQNKNKTYDYLATIILSGVFFSFVAVFFYKTIFLFVDYSFIKFFSNCDWLERNGPNMTTVLLILYFLGGLCGVVIKGMQQLYLPNLKYKINLNFSFLASFLIGAIGLLSVNTYYTFISIPSDGRWKFQLPVTTLFILIYLIIFFFVSKKILKNNKTNYLIWAYNIFLSLIFIGSIFRLWYSFQDIQWQYWKFVATFSYLVILGLGIICYIPLSFFLQKREKYKNRQA